MSEVSVAAAVLAGVVSFASPCVLPMLPTFALILVQDNAKGWRNVLAFLAGFSLVFILLGATASALGQLLWAYQGVLRRLGAVLMVIMGVFLTGLLPLRILAREYRPFLQHGAQSAGGTFLLGAAFSLGWTPCTGPILAAILVYASQADTLGTGVILLLAYSLGFAVPFFLFTAVWRSYLTKLPGVYRFLPNLQKVSGVVLILLGILLWRNDLVKIIL
ncbi:cytochrome c biogenesis CcdA family protein [Selenomonas ruminantium]|uniref:Cytochrome c-type biogenesis protein n=1 Tax=Selenomonas ruminantium TaxID=971 RepID=A0A1H0U7M2_SELRU|nr:cytochrome c biogenesis CcdA family protein [Selenomonas ruminantium]SDP61985.1 cytochrome c-type biogenesis protein [Selenomonas ruminantium]